MTERVLIIPVSLFLRLFLLAYSRFNVVLILGLKISIIIISLGRGLTESQWFTCLARIHQ